MQDIPTGDIGRYQDIASAAFELIQCTQPGTLTELTMQRHGGEAKGPKDDRYPLTVHDGPGEDDHRLAGAVIDGVYEMWILGCEREEQVVLKQGRDCGVSAGCELCVDTDRNCGSLLGRDFDFDRVAEGGPL